MAQAEKIKAAETFARQFGCSKIVVHLLDEDAGEMTTVSWGRSKAACRQAKELGEVLHDEAMEFFRRRLNFDMLGTQE
jgi:hypothetical protein